MTRPGQTADSTAVRRVDGRVVRGTREGPLPVGNQWVVLHRVGPDGAGPVDSVRTSVNGRFHIPYRATGDTTALYFASTSYSSVSYFTSPFRQRVVSGDDATIMVFDTTSGPVAVKLGGRHLIIGAPAANGRRPVGEVYDLENDSTVTLVARNDTSPVWSVHLPAAAVGFQLNANGDIAAGAVSRRGSSVGLFAPLSPGIRQLAFTYELPSSAFPLSVPAERTTGVLEVLVQEPTARIQGAALREMAPVSTDGRVFRRFLSQDVAANAVIGVDLPRIVGAEREKVYIGVVIVLVAAMVIALMTAARRAPRRAFSVRTRTESRSQALVRAIADLDAEFERAPVADATAYEAKRASLKQELANVLAEDRSAT